MLGWHISVYRQQDGGDMPAAFGASRGARLAVWQADVGGLRWLDELVSQEGAVDLGGGGYPSEYTATAASVLPNLRGEPPESRRVWSRGPEDVVTEEWSGRTSKDQEVISACRPDEWLIIQAWDES